MSIRMHDADEYTEPGMVNYRLLTRTAQGDTDHVLVVWYAQDVHCCSEGSPVVRDTARPWLFDTSGVGSWQVQGLEGQCGQCGTRVGMDMEYRRLLPREVDEYCDGDGSTWYYVADELTVHDLARAVVLGRAERQAGI